MTLSIRDVYVQPQFWNKSDLLETGPPRQCVPTGVDVHGTILLDLY